MDRRPIQVDPATVIGCGGEMDTPKSIRAPLSNPPTDAELEAAFGRPAADCDGESLIVTSKTTGFTYLVVSNGEAFFYVAFRRV
jgi:hypothetical protein